MEDKYCYPDSEVLVNKLELHDENELFNAEVKLTSLRLLELQKKPVTGSFDFDHLKKIHAYIFQDLYDWAGEERTVNMGKGNMFCNVAYISSFAQDVFGNYFSDCYAARGSKSAFVKALAENYGDLNALHPFREGNGRAQREFSRLVCQECGYDFDLSEATHEQMLNASKLSFDLADNSGFEQIFSKAVSPLNTKVLVPEKISILTSDDLSIEKKTEKAKGSIFSI